MLLIHFLSLLLWLTFQNNAVSDCISNMDGTCSDYHTYNDICNMLKVLPRLFYIKTKRYEACKTKDPIQVSKNKVLNIKNEYYRRQRFETESNTDDVVKIYLLQPMQSNEQDVPDETEVSDIMYYILTGLSQRRGRNRLSGSKNLFERGHPATSERKKPGYTIAIDNSGSVTDQNHFHKVYAHKEFPSYTMDSRWLYLSRHN
ncbi:unnamed protein product [Leptidea sinapis]|uniref:Uncharacterized protein n=1 Tax=Leptidea sinapis TaxID=189913 RepID=A0A5E4QZF5_9NEOP|nr:unnamed protein product [Leptidea sinapis]